MLPGTDLVPGSQGTEVSAQINFPFTLYFYGTAYNSAWASSKGTLQFGSNLNPLSSTCLPAGGFGSTIFAYWDNIHTDGPGGGIYTRTTGPAGARLFYIEWRGCVYANGNCSNTVNFEVVLAEPSPNIQVIYGAMNANSQTATVGLQNSDGSQTVSFMCHTAMFLTNVRVTYGLGQCPTATATATATATPVPTCGPGADYEWTSTSNSELVGGTTLVPGSQVDDAALPIQLPFTYVFYGHPYNSVNASTNGNLQFNSSSTAYNNACLPYAPFNDAILAHWDDINMSSSISPQYGIYTSVVGLAPNRRFIVEWIGCLWVNGACNGHVDFEARLWEGQPRGDIEYGIVSSSGGSATVGLQKGNGERINMYLCNSPALAQNLEVTFYQPVCAPTATPTFTATATATATATRTSTSTPTVTSTPMNVLVGHVTFQGPPAQPNAKQSQPVALTLCQTDGSGTANYTLSTDTNGLFALSPVGPGSYNWRIKSPKYLAAAGTFQQFAGTTQVEMGLMKAGDSSNDNRVNIQDFNILKATFGKGAGDPGYDDRADFTGEQLVTTSDFNLLKANFGQVGAAVNCQ